MPQADLQLRPSGLLLFIQYGFMPNHLGYCGGNENQELLEHAVAGQSEPALASLLAKFTGAFPYLKTIAEANKITDPFDPKVVEAYWLGNGLLDRVTPGHMARALDDRFGKQLTRKMRDQIFGKLPQGGRPFHLFHVIDVYRHLESKEISVMAMENCRISWGTVKGIEPGELVVDRRPLIAKGNKLVLGPGRTEKVMRNLDGKGFVDQARVGDTVSIHWGWACQVLTVRQAENLVRYSEQHLRLANQTI
ncbi:MAG: DUF6390 family protein [Actinomycetota bacterium]